MNRPATRLLLALSLGTGAAAGGGHGDAVAVWATHAMVKVRPADRPPGRAPAVELRAARNEFEPFQIVLRAEGRPVRAVDVEVSDLADPASGRSISSRHVTVYREGFVELRKPSSRKGDVGPWPDPLLPRATVRPSGSGRDATPERRSAFPFDLEPGRTQGLWIDVYVPTGTPPGSYGGEVRVVAAGATLRVVPIRLEVWPFTLPSTSSLRTSYGLSGVAVVHAHRGRYTTDDDLFDLTQAYAAAALRHRISTHVGAGVPPREGTDGRLDWSSYDREVGPFLDGTVFGDGDPLPGARATSTDVRLPVGLTRGEKARYLQGWELHFRERGWLDRLFLYVMDEPAETDYPRVRAEAEIAHRAAPGIPVLLTEQLAPSLKDAVDIWVPVVNCLEERPREEPTCDRVVPVSAYAALPRARLWFYQSCMSHGCQGPGGSAFDGWPSYVVDADPMAHRVMPWLAFSLGIEGELYYNTVEAQAMGLDPWKEIDVHGGNGDGTLFYPGTPDRIGGRTHVPVESLRLKVIREGLEDYEYLVLLAASGEDEEARELARRLAPGTFRWQGRPEILDALRGDIAARIASRLKGGRT